MSEVTAGGSRYTEEQKRHLLELINKWQKRLRLEHWTIYVKWDEKPDHESAILSIGPVDERQFAVLRIGTFFDVPAAEQENCVCHELLHCVLEPLYREAQLLAWKALSSAEYDRMNGVLCRQVERAVDHLATVLAPIIYDDSDQPTQAKEVS